MNPFDKIRESVSEVPDDPTTGTGWRLSFDDWMLRCRHLRIWRNGAKWRLWGQWPIHAMRAGWDARMAAERLERRLATKRPIPALETPNGDDTQTDASAE